MIWVVSDKQATRDALVPLITAMRYQVAGVECGDDVVKRLRFQTASLVIVDCALPDSFDLITKIRSHPRSATMPVVMFSTDSQNLKEKALLKGADAYVPKGSLDWAELMDEVRRFAGPPSNANEA